MDTVQQTPDPPDQWVDVYQKQGSSWVFRRRVSAPEDGMAALRNRMCREARTVPRCPSQRFRHQAGDHALTG